MRFAIVLAPEAIEDLKRLRSHVRPEVRSALGVHLRNEPTKQSRSRFKRLRRITKPQFRLRVGDVRVFYDVNGRTVEVLAVVQKPDAESWLSSHGQ